MKMKAWTGLLLCVILAGCSGLPSGQKAAGTPG